MTMPHQNWARNLTFNATTVTTPRTVADVQSLVKKHAQVKAFGSRHCFNEIADTNTIHISLSEQDHVLSLDRDGQSVTIEAGIRYGQLSAFLHKNGYALANLASLPHISVAGACATATHGSGNKNGNLATSISEFELVDGRGEIVKLSRDSDASDFSGAAVGLGALGILTKLTLDIEPTFNVRQNVYENLSFEVFETRFDAISQCGYSVSLFTDWTQNSFQQLWQKQCVTDCDPTDLPPTLFGAHLSHVDLHPLPGHSAASCTQQTGIAGPWHERLPHFRLDFTPSSGEELQTEYFVSRENAVPALTALFKIREQIAPLAFVSEVRTIAADELWMSTSFQRDSVAIHFTWKPDFQGVMNLLPTIESTLNPFEARPHWGKLFSMGHEKIAALYPKYQDFVELAKRFDPNGKFRNQYLNTYIYNSSMPQ